MLETQERAVIDSLEDFANPSILDVGGGHGQLAGPLTARGWKVTVAGSSGACRRGIADLEHSGRIEFTVCDLMNLPFADGAYDVVVSVRLIPHCQRWEELIGELCRVARRAVIIDYPTMQSVNAIAPFLFRAKKRFEGNTREWKMFRHDEIERAFAAAGFAVRRRRGQFFLPMVLHRLLKSRSVSSGLESICAAAGLTDRWGSPVMLEARQRENGGR